MLSGISHAAGITLAAAGGELHVRSTVDPILGTLYCVLRMRLALGWPWGYFLRWLDGKV
jgi:hypothetical protein